jgi:adenylosuccinate synthase
MHLDTLAGLKELKLCKAYRIDGKETTFFPGDADALANAECVYETLDGWDEDLSAVEDYDALPENTKKYIAAVETIVKVPVSIVGVGPKRSQAIFRK